MITTKLPFPIVNGPNIQSTNLQIK